MNLTVKPQSFFRSTLNPPEGRILDIHVVTNNKIYAGGDNGVFLKSIDGGSSWELIPTNFKYQISDILFVNETIGFAGTENSTIIRTDNGGVTWQPAFLPADNLKITKLIPFKDFIWATCSNGRIFRTTNLGESWNPVAWPVENSIEDFYFFGDSLAILVTQSGEVYKSHDGIGWFLLLDGIGTSLNSLAYLQSNILLSGGGRGSIFRSTNLGNSWQSVSTGSANAISSLSFYNSTSGFAVSDSGEVYHTSNSGSTWLPYSIPEEFRASIVRSFTPGKVIFGGFEGKINLHTLPDGWQLYHGLPKSNIYSVSTSGIFGMYAASDSGRIYYSLYGIDWQLYKTPLSINLRSIHALGDTLAWAAGDSGYICRRVADTGIWETYQTGFSKNLKSIYGITTKHAIAVGNSGLIILSADGGQSWSQISSPSSENLNSVTFLNKTVGIIVGDNGTVLRSTDAGYSWTAFTSGVTANLVSVTYESYPWAAAVGDSGTILTTYTSGQTWNNRSSQNFQNFVSATFGNASNMFITSGRGNIYRIGLLAGPLTSIYENTDSIYFSSISAKGLGSITVGAYNNITLRHYTNLQIPVELLTFSAKNIDGKIVLTWNTATETNNRGFEVQKSINNKDWFDIGFVTGSGTATEPAVYTFTDSYPSCGIMYYRLRQIDYDGRAEILRQIEVPFESSYELEQNYPNPFNPLTEISYSIPNAGKVSLIVYDALGREVAVLVNKVQEPGRYTVSFNGSSLASGIYYYKISAGKYFESKKMVLLK